MNYVKMRMNKPLVIDEIVSLHYFEYGKDFAFGGEVHDFWELVYADKNEVYVTAGASEYMLNSNQLYLHRPMEFHRVRCNGEKAANSVIVSFTSDCDTLNDIAGMIIDCPYKLKPLLSKIIEEAKSAFSTPLGDPYTKQLIPSEDAPFGSEQLIQAYLEAFLIELIRDTSNTSDKRFTANKESNQEIDAIIKFLEANVYKRLTFSDVCNAFNFSPSYLKKLFRDNVGCGVMEFFNHCKIDCAKQLIREKRMNFTQISEMLSFTTVQYFTRVFKRLTDMTPSQYEASVLSGMNEGIDKYI